MRVTRKIVADKIAAHLHGKLALEALVDWAENAVADGKFEPGFENMLMEAVGSLGLADVHGYEVFRDDCVRMLQRLGYKKLVDSISAIR